MGFGHTHRCLTSKTYFRLSILCPWKVRVVVLGMPTVKEPQWFWQTDQLGPDWRGPFPRNIYEVRSPRSLRSMTLGSTCWQTEQTVLTTRPVSPFSVHTPASLSIPWPTVTYCSSVFSVHTPASLSIPWPTVTYFSSPFLVHTPDSLSTPWPTVTYFSFPFFSAHPSLPFDSVTHRDLFSYLHFQCTPQPRFRSRDPPWPIPDRRWLRSDLSV